MIGIDREQSYFQEKPSDNHHAEMSMTAIMQIVKP
jgi:hypothetical protein